MDRVFYCWPTGGAIPIHPWSVESSPLALTHENLFILCPEHDGLPNNDGPYLAESEFHALVDILRGIDDSPLPR
jgi:hypothetical protein